MTAGTCAEACAGVVSASALAGGAAPAGPSGEPRSPLIASSGLCAHRDPSAEEMRMLRAVAQVALCEAVRRGAYRASFRGFGVDATRSDFAVGGEDVLTVHLVLRQGERILDRCEVEVRRGGCDRDWLGGACAGAGTNPLPTRSV